MNSTGKPKPYVLGLSIGTFWLIAASTGFSIQMLASARTNEARTVVLAVASTAVALLAISLCQILSAVKLPDELRPPEKRKIGRVFAWIAGLEIAAIVVVSIVCYLNGHLSMLVPLVLVVVGIHFFPLAKVFGVPRYTVLGALFCTIPLVTLLVIPAEQHVGSAIARFLISSLGCAAAAWLIAAFSLFEVRRLLSAGRRYTHT